MNMHLGIDQHFNACAREAGWPVLCDAQLGFEREELRLLHQAWRATAGSRTAPMKKDFTPRTLAPLLKQLSFIDAIQVAHGAVRYQFRFFGSALSPVGGDLTGRYLDEIVPEPHLQSWSTAYDLVLSAMVPLRFRSSYNIPELRHLKAESYAAPLIDEDGRATGLLTASVFGNK